MVSSDWSDVQRVSLTALRRLYLGQRTRLDSVRVTCIDLPSGSRERETFSVSVLGKTELQMHDYWIQEALTGGAPPPREARSHHEVLDWVQRRVGAIGYIRWSALRTGIPEGVSVLAIEKGDVAWLPDHPDYPLQIGEPEAALEEDASVAALP